MYTVPDSGTRVGWLGQPHYGYEKLDPWPLGWVESPGVPLSYRIEKMKLNKDKTELTVNPSLKLTGISPEVFRYRLGNRSALEWVIDQYQVSEYKRSGIQSDPNRAYDREYIVRLVGKVVRVSVETVKIVEGLPGENSGRPQPGRAPCDKRSNPSPVYGALRVSGNRPALHAGSDEADCYSR